ncbi:MAG: GntR family transcriptional regulator [Fibrobacteres bacterium]|nr:GntR family transcriptional regulator [Fibrobacterota bacterium]
MKYLDIYSDLKTRINRGTYGKGGRLPFVSELAAEYNASLATVQHSVNMLSAEGLVRGVRSQGLFVQSPAENTLMSSGRKERRIGILCKGPLLRWLAMPYFAEICRGIEHTLDLAGIRCYFITCKWKSYQEILKEIRVLELESLCLVDIQDKPLRTFLEGARLPMVYTDIYEARGRIPLVLGDNVRGGFLSAQKMIAEGHRRLLFICARQKSGEAVEAMAQLKWKGIQEAASRQKGVKLYRRVYNAAEKGSENELTQILDKYRYCTAILMPGKGLFEEVKKVMEKGFSSLISKRDFVLFDCTDKATYIGEKKVFVCRWDGIEMGRKSAEILVGQLTGRARVNYVPMWVE